MNKNPARCFSLLAAYRAALFSILFLLTLTTRTARPDALEDCVERLAKKTAALPHERRMSLVWTNHAAFSEQRAERLRAAFVTQMENAQVRLVQGEAAPSLRVAIEQTPSRVVFTATVPAEGSTNVVIEELPRAMAGIDDNARKNVRLAKELIWQQESKILSAALLSADEGEKRLAILAEDSLTIYQPATTGWSIAMTKTLPGPRQLPRTARGELLVVEDRPQQLTILTPGRRCEASLRDEAPLTCGGSAAEWPAGKLMALPSCGTQTWWLKSDASDWTSEDRLLLRSAAGAKETAPIAELEVPGPVISISAGQSIGDATIVVRNLVTGNYEVYRVLVACGD